MKYIREFENHAAYEAAKSGLILPNVSLCVQENEVHYNPYVDPCASEKVKTTYEWVEIGGVKWATKNVGALTITDYGQKFSWGGVNGFTADQVTGDCHSKRFSWVDYEFGNGTSSPSASDMTKYNSTDGKTVLDAEDDAATVNMGSGWRMPTTEEYVTLGTAVTTAWTQVDGVYGILCTDKNDSSKTLFFPAAGECSNGSVKLVGTGGGYWSSSLNTSGVANGYQMLFGIYDVYWQTYDARYIGCSVRGVVG